MTTRKGNIVTIEREEPQQCDLCGKIAELRPYGPNGECVCFQCGMLNQESAVRAFGARIDADPALIEKVIRELDS